MNDVFEAGRLEHCDESCWIGQVRDALGEVAIGGTIGEQATDQWHDATEVDAISEPHERVVRNPHVEQADSPVGSYHSMQFAKEGVEIDEVA